MTDDSGVPCHTCGKQWHNTIIAGVPVHRCNPAVFGDDVWDIRLTGTREQVAEYMRLVSAGDAWLSSGIGDTYQEYTEDQRDTRNGVTGKSCGQCSRVFTPKRTDSKFCSQACKQKAYRHRNPAQ